MCIKRIYFFLFLLIIGTFVYGQDNFQKEAEIRSYCQFAEQIIPNSGALAWGLIHQLNPTFDEKLVTVGKGGIKRIGLCQLNEDVLKMTIEDSILSEHLYTEKGSISIVSGICGYINYIVKTHFPDDQKAILYIIACFILYGTDEIESLSSDEREIIFKIVNYADNFQKGIF